MYMCISNLCLLISLHIQINGNIYLMHHGKNCTGYADVTISSQVLEGSINVNCLQMKPPLRCV